MMKQAITMTTDIRVVSAPDLSVANEVINLSCVPLPEDEVLAGVYWFSVGCSACEALQSVLRFVYGLIVKKMPGYRVWLLVGNSAWQPDTRIVRHRKLWGALTARGINISHSCNAQEVMREEDGALKFFGSVQLSELSTESVVNVLLEENCSYIVALPGTIEPDNFVDIGWSGDLSGDFKIIETLIKCGGLLFKRSGEFDDKEKGIVGVGQPALVNLFVS